MQLSRYKNQPRKFFLEFNGMMIWNSITYHCYPFMHSILNSWYFFYMLKNFFNICNWIKVDIKWIRNKYFRNTNTFISNWSLSHTNLWDIDLSLKIWGLKKIGFINLFCKLISNNSDSYCFYNSESVGNRDRHFRQACFQFSIPFLLQFEQYLS